MMTLVLRAGLSLTLGLLLTGCQEEASPVGKKVVVLGFDGMDHALAQRLIEAGRLPSLARLAAEGFGAPLETSVPPLSPVAWSEFITGMDAGGHGIFDFIHRDPETMQPYLSTSRIETTEPWLLPASIGLGDCVLPLAAQTQTNRRLGQPFWERLESAGIPTQIIRMPANYPPSGQSTAELSGMGTPDLLGTYGTFSFYGTGLFIARRSLDGGEVYPVELQGRRVEAELFGPANPFSAVGEQTRVPFSLELGAQRDHAMLEIAGQVLRLEPGQWSPWIAVEFDLDCVPFVSVSGIVRFYLRALSPEVELYASPVNIDPISPVQPISTPQDYAARLAEATGRFYTQGMMEDTKALSTGTLTRPEFLDQAALAAAEIERQYFHLLGDFDDGLLFYYFGNLDQVSHMMYRHLDSAGDDPRADPALTDVVPGLYLDADRIVGETLERLAPEDLLIVMSDHGFAPWRRTFHLNAWLREQGYLVAKKSGRAAPGPLANIDWERTRAYGLGFNGLYLNIGGRERNGSVPSSEAPALLEEIAARLRAAIDPASGRPAVSRTYSARGHYARSDALGIGPDLVVGYARGFRNHSDSALGLITGDVFGDNADEWSGDHAIDHTEVPGVLFASRPLRASATSLRELSQAILAEFGLE